MSRRLLVLMLLPMFVVMSRGIAEASRYDFNGAGNEEIVVWDGSFEVSTESNFCDQGGCGTVVPQFASLAFVLSGEGAQYTTFTSLSFILMSSTACGPNTNCDSFEHYFPPTCDPNNDPGCDEHEYDFGSRELNRTNFRYPQQDPNNPQPRPNLFFVNLVVPGGSSFDGQVFGTRNCNQDCENLLAAFLAAPDLRIGLDAQFAQNAPNGFLRFSLDLQHRDTQDPPSVPEPATLALVGTGIAAGLARRRARKS